MKLIKEFIINEILLLFIALIVIEGFILFLLSKRAEIIYDETYNETIDKIVNKTLEAVQKFETFAKNYLFRYLADLKLISMHSILFNINSTQGENLNLQDKVIVPALKENLDALDNTSRFKDYEDNLFVNSYEKEFENISDTNFILKSLFDNEKHPELNSQNFPAGFRFLRMDKP